MLIILYNKDSVPLPEKKKACSQVFIKMEFPKLRVLSCLPPLTQCGLSESTHFSLPRHKTLSMNSLSSASIHGAVTDEVDRLQARQKLGSFLVLASYSSIVEKPPFTQTGGESATIIFNMQSRNAVC